MTILINPIASPIQIGCYENDQKICQKEIKGKVSDVLLKHIEDMMDQYDVERFIYTSGPGSYMAIKLTYITLKTIESLRGVPFDACSAFELSGNKPIKAMGKLYFVKEKETIITQKFDEEVTQEFGLPDYLGSIVLEHDNTPLYIIPAV